MSAQTTTYADEQASTNQETCVRPRCPLCHGLLMPLRGNWRCCRCSFTLCEGCEGGTAENSCRCED